MGKDFNICNPGYGASCALCCGSHNFVGKAEEMEEIFKCRQGLLNKYSKDYIIKHMLSSRSNLTGSYYFSDEIISHIPELPPRDSGNPSCPFISFDEGLSRAGCLIYSSDDSITFDCYRNYRSKHFSCKAKEELSEKEIIFAAKLMSDWFYYSMLIHHMDYLKSLIKEYKNPDSIPYEELKNIKSVLEEYINSKDFLNVVHSYFS